MKQKRKRKEPTISLQNTSTGESPSFLQDDDSLMGPLLVKTQISTKVANGVNPYQWVPKTDQAGKKVQHIHNDGHCVMVRIILPFAFQAT